MAEYQWSPAMLSGSYYKDFPALPIGGPPVFSLTASVKSKYKIPAEVFNPGRSHVDFDFGIAATANLKRSLHLGKIMPIAQIKWTASNGQVLADCQYVAQQTSIVLPNIKVEELQDRTLTCSRFSQATIDTCPYGELIHPVRKAHYMTQVDDGTQVMGSGSSYAFGANDGGHSLLPNLAGTAAAPGVPSSGEMAISTAVGSLAANIPVFFRVRVNFKDLVDSLFAYDKDLYFGPQETQLEITWRDTQHWGYQVTGAATPSLAGSAAITVAPAVLGTSGINVQIAQQQNPKICDNVKAVMSAGDFRMMVPMQEVYVQALAAAATKQAISVPITASPGSRLLRCWTVVNNPNDGTVYMSNNNLDKQIGVAAGNTTVLYSAIRTALGSKYLQDNQLDAGKGEDYNWLREKLRGSAVIDWDTFRQFSFFVDNFTSGSKSYDWPEENKDLGGIPNDGSITYKVEVTLTNAAACVVYVLFTLQKTLTMTSSGPQIL